MNNIKLYHTIERDEQYRRSQPKPPSHILDMLADRKFDGGYKPKLNPTCTVCHVAKSRSGDCECTY